MFKFTINNTDVETYNNRAVKVTISGVINDYFSAPVEILNSLEFYSTRVFQGVAVCSENDIFDPVIGERIAESRAKIQLFKFMKDFTKDILASYKKLLTGYPDNEILHTKHGIADDSLIATVEKYKFLYIQEKEHLNKLLGK